MERRDLTSFPRSRSPIRCASFHCPLCNARFAARSGSRARSRAKPSAGLRACALPPPRGPEAEGAVRLRGRSGSGSRNAAAPRGAGQGRAGGGAGSAGRSARSGRPEERRMSATLYVLSTLGGYVLTSALLLKCPGLLHRPKRQRFRCRHISHRGGEWGGGR